MVALVPMLHIVQNTHCQEDDDPAVDLVSIVQDSVSMKTKNGSVEERSLVKCVSWAPALSDKCNFDPLDLLIVDPTRCRDPDDSSLEVVKKTPKPSGK
ncbi:hypothetical protein AAVH_39015, partial [Aphelenchoides avenae]